MLRSTMLLCPSGCLVGLVSPTTCEAPTSHTARGFRPPLPAWRAKPDGYRTHQSPVVTTGGRSRAAGETPRGRCSRAA